MGTESTPETRDWWYAQTAKARGAYQIAIDFDRRAAAIDERVATWRKDRPRDDGPVVAMTLHGVARDLRRWAEACQTLGRGWAALPKR